MEADRHPASQWLDAATREIRFGPDRRAVRAELEAHLEDKALDLQRIFPDLPPEECRRRAEEEMGDAKEIGLELARIHRPWLGYAWLVSKVLIGLACLLLVLAWVPTYDDISFDDLNTGSGRGNYWELWDFDNLPYPYQGDKSGRYLPGGGSGQRMAETWDWNVQVQGQTVRLLRGALWESPQSDRLTLYLYLRLETWKPWERGRLERDWISVTDDLGNLYTLGEEPVRKQENDFHASGYGLFHAGCELVIPQISPDAQWVRVAYGPGTAPIFSFTIPLKEVPQP